MSALGFLLFALSFILVNFLAKHFALAFPKTFLLIGCATMVGSLYIPGTAIAAILQGQRWAWLILFLGGVFVSLPMFVIGLNAARNAIRTLQGETVFPSKAKPSTSAEDDSVRVPRFEPSAPTIPIDLE